MVSWVNTKQEAEAAARAPKLNNKKFTDALDHVLKISSNQGKPTGMWTNLDSVVWAVEKGLKFNTIINADTMLGLWCSRSNKTRKRALNFPQR